MRVIIALTGWILMPIAIIVVAFQVAMAYAEDSLSVNKE